MRITAAFVVGQDHLRAELANRLDERAHRGLERLEGKAPLGQWRQRVAFGQARVDETEELLLHTEDLPGPGHLRAPDLRQVRPDIRPFHRLVQDVTALATGQRADQDICALPGITGHRRGALARFIIGMGVHRHQPQRGVSTVWLTGCPGVRPSGFTGGARSHGNQIRSFAPWVTGKRGTAQSLHRVCLRLRRER
jgi:hypothetical protein